MIYEPMNDLDTGRMSTDVNTLSTVDRALSVLAVLARHGSALSAIDLVKKTGLSQSTLYRQLAALKKWGFALEVDGRYAPGPLSLQLALGFDARADMWVLAQQTQESVGLIVAVNGQAICIDMIDSQQSLRCSFEKGRSVPLHKGASAKCLLAHLPSRDLSALLQPLMGDGSPENIGFLAELAAIRKAGFVVSDGEVDPGVWGVSAPLFSLGRRPVGVLTLMAPSVRVENNHSPLIQMTVITAARITRSLNTPS
jgi:DNA-binding IclR family transcriptional regulator